MHAHTTIRCWQCEITESKVGAKISGSVDLFDVFSRSTNNSSLHLTVGTLSIPSFFPHRSHLRSEPTNEYDKFVKANFGFKRIRK
jgi:hypothetical protein